MSQLVSPATTSEPSEQKDLPGPPAANRHRLPNEHSAITHHFSIAGHEGYVTVGLYPNGQPGGKSSSGWRRQVRRSPD
jgi:ribonucleoside-diphosphate reductase alpha chain